MLFLLFLLLLRLLSTSALTLLLPFSISIGISPFLLLLLLHLCLCPLLGGLLLGVNLLLRLELFEAAVAAGLLQVDVLAVDVREAHHFLLRLEVLHRVLSLLMGSDHLLQVGVPVGLRHEALEKCVAPHEVVNISDAPVRHGNLVELEKVGQTCVDQGHRGRCLKLTLKDNDVVACVRWVIQGLWATH